MAQVEPQPHHPNIPMPQNLKGKISNALSASTNRVRMPRNVGAVSVENDDVFRLPLGLSVLVPDLVGIEGDNIIVYASSEKI
jgi:hypothetical protein